MDVSREIKRIVAEVLEIEDYEEVSEDSEFFEMGGNSLMAMMVVEKIQDEFSIAFDFSSLYEHTTIREISDIVGQKIAANN